MFIKNKNRKVVIGGTFDFFHKGHRTFLNKAFGLGSVFIGLTSDKMALKTKKRKVQTFENREKELVNFIENSFEKDYIIGKIEDEFGPTLNEDFDYIVVSPETKITALRINEERRKIDREPIEIVQIEFVLADDGKPISSTRIFKREIDKEGRLLK